MKKNPALRLREIWNRMTIRKAREGRRKILLSNAISLRPTHHTQDT